MFRSQITRALTLATIISLMMSSVALADTVTVSNTVVANTNVTKAPGTTGTGYVRVVPSNGTPAGDTNGCNVRPDDALTVNLESNNSKVTLDDSSVVVTTCDVDVPFTYAVASDATVSATIRITSVSGGRTDGVRTYSTSDTLVITISAPANTAPTVPGAPELASGSATPNTGAFSLTWAASTDAQNHAISYALQAKDANDAGYTTIQSGLTTAGYTFAAGAPAEGTWTYRVIASDASSSSAASAASSEIVVDRSGPSAPTVTTNPLAVYFPSWFKDTVTVSYSGGSDPALADGSAGSGIANYSAPQTFTSTGSHAYSGAATDVVGNAGTAATGSVQVDSSNPTYDCRNVPTGWSATNYEITCDAADTGSGLKSAAEFKLTTSVAAGTETDAASTDSKTVSDNVDHTVTASLIDLKVDRKAPALDCATADGAWHAANVSITCTATDSGSGLADAANDAEFSLATTVADGVETNNASTGTRPVADAVGNSATAGPIAGNMIDRKDPAAGCDPAPTTWSATDITIQCTASDGGSGLEDAADETFSLSTSVTAGTETSNASTGSKTIDDNVDNQTTVGPISGLKVDKKAPEISGADVHDTTWRNTPLSRSFTATDGGSGLADADNDAAFTLTASADSTRLPLGVIVPTEVSNVVADNVGNSSTRTLSAWIDTKAPTIENLGTTDAPNAAGWYKTAVSNDFRAADGLSGFTGKTDPYTFAVSSGTAEGSAVKISSSTVNDVAGNTSASIDSAAFKIDLSKPTNVQFQGAVNSYVFGTVPTQPTCTADDAVSGVASCVVTGYNATAVGTHTMTATATDFAGNTETATRSYSVQAWTLNGFYSPVDMNSVVNSVKGGSTVPLKFEIFAGSTELTSTDAIASFTVTRIACLTGATMDEIEMTTTGGTSLRYDTTGGQFIQNWKTPTGSNCYKVTMTTDDGSTLVALFKTR